MTTVNIIQGNCLQTLKTLPAGSVQCVVTSPPYYGLRDYGTTPEIWGGDHECTHDWQEHIQPAANGIIHSGGMSGETLSGNSRTRQPKKSNFCSICGAWQGSYGAEPRPELYVEHTVWIFREVRRVLRPDGTLWLNLGDSYAGSGGAGGDYNKGGLKEGQPKYKSNMKIDRSKRKAKRWGGGNIPATGDLKPKDLIGIPWMVAFALRADGWYLRSDIIWAKPNPMPESVTDRPTKSHEYIFLLSKSAKYYYDNEAITETVTDSTVARLTQPTLDQQIGSSRVPGKTNGNMKAVGQAYSFARKVKESPVPGMPNQHREDREDINYFGKRNKRSVWTVTTKPYKEAHFATFPPDLIEPCILAGSREGDTVLDPFNGSGTTGAVAIKHHRNYIGCELNPEYIKLTNRRLSRVQPVLMEMKL